MDFSVSPVIAYILAWLGIVGGIGFLFSHAEDSLKPEIKQSISNWLKNLDAVGPVRNWPSQFAAVFDRTFGEDHLTWRCFFRSCIASLTSVVIFILIWSIFRQREFDSFVSSLIDQNAFSPVIFFLGAPIAFNFIPDYLSLLETRFIISRMGLRHSIVEHVGLLVADFILTGIIIFVFFLTIFSIEHLFTDQAMSFVKLTRHHISAVEQGFRLSVFGTGNINMGIFFYSTYITSVWVWLYALSGFMVKLAQKLDISWSWLKRFLNIDEKPLRSMAMVSILIVTIIFVVVPFVR